MRFSWTQGRVMAAATAILAFHGSLTAIAQFVPYSNAQQGYAQPGQQQYQPQAYPHYSTAMAYQGSGNRAASPTLTQPTETIAPGQQAANYAPQAAPAQNYAAPAAVNGQGCQPAPAVSYPQPAPAYSAPAYSAPAYNVGGCTDSYNTFSNGGGFYGDGAGGGNYLGLGARRGCGRQWFGGVYGLYMERDGNPWKALAFSTSTANGPGYYPTDTEFVLNLNNLDNDTFGGAEVRLGATFGGGYDPCGSGCGCGPRHAWEVGYWGLAEDEQVVSVTDLAGDGTRLYGMIDYRGLEYDPGTGYRPVNDYYDYGPPTQTPVGGADVIEIRSIVARNKFSAQNVEINLLHLPVLSGGSCGAAYGGGGVGGRGLGGSGGRGYAGGGCAGGCGGGGCAAGGCAYGSGCDGGSCGAGSGCGLRGGYSGYSGPRYSLTTLIGARYLRLDEDFMFRTNFENITTPGTGFLSHNIDVDNHLVGAQLGCNGVYHLGCSGRWALHCNSTVGVYGNHMEVWNRMDSPTGTVRFANGTNANFDLRYEDDDIAMIGELRVGTSYQYSCNWRFFGGYRLLGISGVALAFDQIADAAITPNQVSYVDSDGSIFLHGLQAGVECTY